MNVPSHAGAQRNKFAGFAKCKVCAFVVLHLLMLKLLPLVSSGIMVQCLCGQTDTIREEATTADRCCWTVRLLLAPPPTMVVVAPLMMLPSLFPQPLSYALFMAHCIFVAAGGTYWMVPACKRIKQILLRVCVYVCLFSVCVCVVQYIYIYSKRCWFYLRSGKQLVL